MIDGEKVGVGIITCNRKEFFKNLILSLKDVEDIDSLVVVQDKKNEESETYIEYFDYDRTDVEKNVALKNFGVAKSKNICLDFLLKNNCDHIFLIEDDMVIKNPNIFRKYIETSKKTGIQHMMFAYHGPANKNGVSGGLPTPRVVIEYDEDTSISLNTHCVGAFCYYSRKSLLEVGLIDEKFKNAFDHVSHSYSLALKGYSTPYWWWCDVSDSLEYIEEQQCSEVSSTIKTEESMIEWRRNINNSIDLFYEKFGYRPFRQGGVPDVKEQVVYKFLKSVLP